MKSYNQNPDRPARNQNPDRPLIQNPDRQGGDNPSTQKPLSPAKLAANRANALKSTGPRSPEGKARSSQNAITHGLTATGARSLTALGEDLSLLPATIESFALSWQPQSSFEYSLVQSLATLQLRLDRCVRMETGILDSGIPKVAPEDSHERVNAALGEAFIQQQKALSIFYRYESNLSRAFDRTLKQLLALRKAGLPPTPADLGSPSRLGRDQSTKISETKPTLIENKQPPPPPPPHEPTQIAQRQALGAQAALCDFQENRRTDPDPPASPEDSLNRRHGSFEPFPTPEEPIKELVWILPDGSPYYPTRPDRPKLYDLLYGKDKPQP